MTTVQPPARASHLLVRTDFYLAALLGSVALVMAALVLAAQEITGPLPAVRWLALAPLVIAAYSRYGLQVALVLTLFFTSALLPSVLAAWGTPAFTAMAFDLLVYGIMLGAVGYLAATTAAFLRTRQTLSGAVRDWEGLLARASQLEEVAAFVLRQSGALVQARSALLLLLNPVDRQWEAFGLQGSALARFPLAERERRATLAHWLIEQRRALILDNLPDDLRFSAPPAGAGQVIHTLLAQPLAGQEGGLIAVLVLLNKRRGPFLEADFAALAELTAAAQKALEQASQYARTDHALARRVRQLAALQRTARELNATQDPQAIVDEALACALAISGGEAALVAVDLPGLGQAQRASPAPAAATVVDRALDGAGQLPHPLLISEDDDSFYSLLERPGQRVVAPIRRAGSALGLILVESSRPQAFGQEALRTVASLADHAAVALDNTLLFSAILREKRKSEEIVETLADALMTVDPAGRVATFNPAAEALTGWRGEEAVGRVACEVLGCGQDPTCQEQCRIVQALQEGQRLHEERWTIRQRLGTQRVVAVNAAPLPAGDGQAGGLVMLLRDVTEAQELDRIQREMITSISHELRTPLTNIHLITEMMLGAGADADAGTRDAGEREQLHLLQAQSQRLEQFAERMLELSRLEEGALRLEPRPLPLHFALAQAADQWRANLPQLAVTAPPGALWVWADEQAVQGVLSILLDNAAKYTPAGSAVELAAAAGPAGYATVAVGDQGPGIAAEHQSRLFERFYRADASDAQRVYGHGLGLYLAQRLVAQMGGQIWVESEVGRGSRFAFTLPLLPEGFDEDLGD